MRSRPTPKKFTALNLPIALTIGEPAGIGPDITALAWLQKTPKTVPFFVIGDPGILRDRVKMMGLSVPIEPIDYVHDAIAIFPQALPVLPMNDGDNFQSPLVPGILNPDYAELTINAIVVGYGLVKGNLARALVTNPIQKSILQEVGFPFPGHTEFLAHLDMLPKDKKAKPVSMMLLSTQIAPPLRVVPMTIHVALSQVPKILTTDKIIEQARIVQGDLIKKFGIAAPRLALCGLNPHAGEEGLMGDEEQRILAPALAHLRAQGMDIAGPLPADSLFHQAARSQFDAILCCYHDQALIPLKTLDFMGGVNVTLGLSIIRTSPDHGTALSLAGGKNGEFADPTSLKSALDLAAKLL